MDAISMARELGKQIQADERYKAYHTARELNDKDEALQKLIADFNEKRMELSGEMAKPDKDTDKLQQLDGEIKTLYGNIMKNENMTAFNNAKEAMDELLSQVNFIITASANGEDPETCPTEMPHSCGGSCATCGGCH